MRSRKLLEVLEDEDRVYFSFYSSKSETKIIGLPKKTCSNKSIYAGTNFNSLNLVEPEMAKMMLDSLMKKALVNHHSTSLCDSNIIKLIGG